MTTNEIEQLSRLITTMRHLRSPQGCPWDRQQTLESLRPFILEEAYELVDAIDSGNEDEILDELGDLLLQVVFQAQIFSETGKSNLGDIAQRIDDKLRRRHPQIFATTDAENPHQSWEQIKIAERQKKGQPTDLQSRLASNLPALKLADKVCRHLGKNAQGAENLPAENDHSRKISPETRLGAAIFELVRQAQQNGIDSELALRKYALKQLDSAPDQDNENVDPESRK